MYKKTILIFLALLSIVTCVDAVNLKNGLVINTSISNSSMTFGFNTTADRIEISPTQVFLRNFVDRFGRTCDITHNSVNNNIDSITFNCTVSNAGGGGGGTPSQFARKCGILDLNSSICNLTYKPAHEEDYHLIGDIIEENNLTESWTTIRSYIDCWQEVCSDLINKSLFEGLVCDETGKYLLENDKYSFENISVLKQEIEKNVTISLDLTRFYIDNYEDRCLEKIIPKITKKQKDISFALFILFLLGLMLIVTYENNNKKKKIKIAEYLTKINF